MTISRQIKHSCNVISGYSILSACCIYFENLNQLGTGTSLLVFFLLLTCEFTSNSAIILLWEACWDCYCCCCSCSCSSNRCSGSCTSNRCSDSLLFQLLFWLWLMLLKQVLIILNTHATALCKCLPEVYIEIKPFALQPFNQQIKRSWGKSLGWGWDFLHLCIVREPS